jgi:hypothetical protein
MIEQRTVRVRFEGNALVTVEVPALEGVSPVDQARAVLREAGMLGGWMAELPGGSVHVQLTPSNINHHPISVEGLA